MESVAIHRSNVPTIVLSVRDFTLLVFKSERSRSLGLFDLVVVSGSSVGALRPGERSSFRNERLSTRVLTTSRTAAIIKSCNLVAACEDHSDG